MTLLPLKIHVECGCWALPTGTTGAEKKSTYPNRIIVFTCNIRAGCMKEPTAYNRCRPGIDLWFRPQQHPLIFRVHRCQIQEDSHNSPTCCSLDCTHQYNQPVSHTSAPAPRPHATQEGQLPPPPVAA